MPPSGDERFVTYRQFASWGVGGLASVLALAVAMVSTAWSVHTDQPHKGAATLEDIKRLDAADAATNRRIETNMERVDAKLDRILERIPSGSNR